MVDNLKERADEMQEATAEKPAAEDSGTGNQPKSSSLIAGANAAAERLEAANAKMERLVEREEQIAAARMLGGVTEAGKAPIAETQEDKDKKVVEDMLSRFE